jgi:hypothetical protein
VTIRYLAFVSGGKRNGALKVLFAGPAAPKDTTSAECPAAMTWAPRLQRVFDIDIETCKSCGGHVKIIACIEDPVVIAVLLTHIDNKAACWAARGSPPCRAPPQGKLFRLIGVQLPREASGWGTGRWLSSRAWESGENSH